MARDRQLTGPSPARIVSRPSRSDTRGSQPQLAAGASDVQAAAAHLARSGREERRRGQRPRRDRIQRGDQVEHRGLLPVTDVDRTPDVAVGGQQVGAHDVGDVDPVAGLTAVPEHRRRRAGHRQAAEDRHHARLAVDVLAGTVDVAVAQRDGRQAVQALVERGVALGRVLALAVGGQRRDRMVLWGGQHVGVAVQASAGRGVHQPRRPVGACGLEHREHAQDVAGGVRRRVLHREAHVDLGGQVKHRLRPGLRERRGDARRVTDIDLGQPSPAGQRTPEVLALARGQVVDHGHRVPAGHERVDEVGADESRAPGDHAVHGA